MQYKIYPIHVKLKLSNKIFYINAHKEDWGSWGNYYNFHLVFLFLNFKIYFMPYLIRYKYKKCIINILKKILKNIE